MAEETSLSEQILDLPDEVWKKLRDALGVGSRLEAAELVASDPASASIAASILGKSALTKEAPKSEGSLLTSKPRARAPVADRMYGKSRGVTF